MSRQQLLREHPDFPFLIIDDLPLISRVLSGANLLKPGEQVTHVAKAGEGNMNLTLRVSLAGAGSPRNIIVKQARPWVEKYDSIPAPWERSIVEAKFYQRVESNRTVASRMPKLLASIPSAKVIVLEDLGRGSDYTTVYQGVELPSTVLADLATWLRALHTSTRDKVGEGFENAGMRQLNQTHIFDLPLKPECPVDLEAIEPALASAAKTVRADEPYKAIVKEMGQRYLTSTGPCLLHGDFFPGSFIATARGVAIIDPEFCFPGDPEFDLAVCCAHIALADEPWQSARRFIEAYDGKPSPSAKPLDRTLLARYAGIEVMRRLIGVAQLPLRNEGQRGDLLLRSRDAVLQGKIETLWNH